MSVTVVGAPALQRKLAAMQGPRLRATLADALRTSALVVQNDAKRRAPIRTGNLRRSIHMEVDPVGLVATVGTDAIYARMQEYGGVVSPKNVTFLRFVVDGQEIFTKGPVFIPAHPYLRPALDENVFAIRREFEQSLDAALRRAA